MTEEQTALQGAESTVPSLDDFFFWENVAEIGFSNTHGNCEISIVNSGGNKSLEKLLACW